MMTRNQGTEKPFASYEDEPASITPRKKRFA